MESPSKVAVPRPISSRMTKDRGPAWLRMVAVSTISTMKVERPRARSSAAPTRLNRRSMTPITAFSAGTKAPICARMAMSAFWRKSVLLPAMLGPVKSHMRRSLSAQSLAMKGGLSGSASSAISTTGWRPRTTQKLRLSSTFGRV